MSRPAGGGVCPAGIEPARRGHQHPPLGERTRRGFPSCAGMVKLPKTVLMSGCGDET